MKRDKEGEMERERVCVYVYVCDSGGKEVEFIGSTLPTKVIPHILAVSHLRLCDLVITIAISAYPSTSINQCHQIKYMLILRR